MKKVGIVTMRGGENFGNALQNYAVQTLLEQFDIRAVTMDNRTVNGFAQSAAKDSSAVKKLAPSYIKSWLRVRLGKKYGSKNDRDFTPAALLRSKKSASRYRAAKKHRKERFADFRKRMLHDDTVPMDKDHIDAEHIATFDAFVCGSDQIWNPYYPENSMIDFLQFAPEQQRIAIAPSFGVSELPDSRKEIFKEWIASIPHLSVREDAGAKIIRELTGRDAAVLLDPTFGLTAEQWLSFAKKPENCPQGKYVFCYFLGNRTKKYNRYIQQYAKQNSCQIVDAYDVHDMTYFDIDPQEFVWLLANAEAVFTDSFHGTAFSLNLQKPFVVFDRVEGGASMSSRITSVLKKTGMEDRTFAKTPEVAAADFTKAEAVISAERETILTYLRQAIETATK